MSHAPWDPPAPRPDDEPPLRTPGAGAEPASEALSEPTVEPIAEPIAKPLVEPFAESGAGPGTAAGTPAPAPQETRDVEAHAAAVGADPFAPAGVEFRSVSSGLITVRLITALGWLALPLIGSVVLAVLVDPTQWWWWIGTVVMLAIMAWVAWLVPRQVRAIGYAEAAEDLLIRKGIMFRSLVVVPYGRLQYVDVNAGPLDRRFGVAKVQLHTASASTDAVLPGLAPREAARLRDRLSEAGEAQLAGL